MHQEADKLKNIFLKRFGEEPTIIRSPGRVNIIGEHTDYNDGFVLPGAINLAVFVGISKRTDNSIKLYADDYNEDYECSLHEVKPTEKQWPNYILGVVDQLQKNNFTVGGFNLAIGGNIPLGAGLSSSAAVECASIYALNHLFNLNIEKLKMIKMAQLAEHTFAGVLCGIMDQFASMMGKQNHVIKLDCRSLDYEYYPFNMEGLKILLLNTNVKHSLASTEYNTRRKECHQAVELINAFEPHVQSLRDVTEEMIDQYVMPKNSMIAMRSRFVVQENQRVIDGCNDLLRGDIESLGKRMFEAHEGLSKMYEVSCRELDWLVNFVKSNDAVLGARMMGGGFGGCTINLIKEDSVEELINQVEPAYLKAIGLPLSYYIASIEDGSEIIIERE